MVMPLGLHSRLQDRNAYSKWIEICKLLWRLILPKVGTPVKLSKISRQSRGLNKLVETVLIELSPTAKANLEKLQSHSLDKHGRQPAASQIIERLINAAAVNVPDAPYPS